MKIVKSMEEGVWTESTSTGSEGIFNVLSLAPKKEKPEKKEKLSEKISSSAQEIYERHKPVLTENDYYTLVSVSILLGKVKYQGIINYRLNGTHEQLRIEGITGIK